MYLQWRLGMSVFAIADSRGTNEIQRVHFSQDRFSCGWGANSVGQFHVESVDYNYQTGCLIKFKDGYEVFVPPQYCQATVKYL